MDRLIISLLLVANSMCHVTMEEPLGCSRFDYEYKVLGRILDLEHSCRALQDENEELKKLVENQELQIEKLRKGLLLYLFFLYFRRCVYQIKPSVPFKGHRQTVQNQICI